MNASEAKALFKKEFFDGEKILSSENDIIWAIEKAYQDMTPRTISGVGKVGGLKDICCKKVLELIREYRRDIPKTQDEFNEKHSHMCTEFLECLNAELDKHRVAKQKYGKAQKIINMTFKYLFCFEDASAEHFQFCHMPLDSYLLNWYKSEVNSDKIPAWSNLDEIQYTDICGRIREHIKNQQLYKEDESIQKADTILECEFLIWQEEKRKMLLKLLKSYLKACTKDSYFKARLSSKDKEIFNTALTELSW